MSERPPLAEYLRVRRAQVDAALERWLPAPPACPAIVTEVMRYSLFAGGKRLRPILALAAAEAVAERLGTPGGDLAWPSAVTLALPAACALEFIHTYSLVHDDLPAMDDDTLRRGRLTCHVVFGDGMAILAGDALLTEAFAVLAREPADGPPDLERRRLRTLGVVAAAAGAAGMVGGQALDLQAAGRGPVPAPALDADGLRNMHARKTGALFRAAAVAGALMAGAPDPLAAAVDDFAAELGLAFQIVDDILDVEGAAEELGKTAGKDAAAGKPTYPAVYGLEESRRLAVDGIARARARLSEAGLGGYLPALAEWVGDRRH